MSLNIKELYLAARADWHAAQKSWQTGIDGLQIPNSGLTKQLASSSTELASKSNNQTDSKKNALQVAQMYQEMVDFTPNTIVQPYTRTIVDTDRLRIETARLVLSTDRILVPSVALHVFRFGNHRRSEAVFGGYIDISHEKAPYELPYMGLWGKSMININPDQVNNELANQFFQAAERHGYVYPAI